MLSYLAPSSFPLPTHMYVFLKRFTYCFMCMSACLHVCMCTTCVPGARGHKVLDPMELELQTTVSYYVGLGNKTWALGPLQEKQVLLATE